MKAGEVVVVVVMVVIAVLLAYAYITSSGASMQEEVMYRYRLSQLSPVERDKLKAEAEKEFAVRVDASEENVLEAKGIEGTVEGDESVDSIFHRLVLGDCIEKRTKEEAVASGCLASPSN